MDLHSKNTIRLKRGWPGDAFDSEDPVAKGTGEYVKARGSSFPGVDSTKFASGVSSDKASSIGVSAAGSMSSNFGVPTTTHAPGVSVDQEPAATEAESVVHWLAGGDRHSIPRSVRWGEATGGNWEAKRGSELEGDTLDKKEVYSKIKQGGMSAEELDSWRTENNVKMTGKAQAILEQQAGPPDHPGQG